MEKIDKKNTLVSVIVATYRRDETLKNAIYSLIKQTYKNIEIIVIDDNADINWNNKVKEILSIFEEYKNIFYIRNEKNLGSAKTRNIGIDIAKGKYITFLDDDDIYLPNKIEKQFNFMEENNLDYSITDLDLFNEKNQLIDRRVRNYLKKKDASSLFSYHLKYHLTGTDTMMFKKEYLIKIGKFALIDVGDEFYLMQRAIENNGKFGYLIGSDIKAYVHTEENGLSSGEGKINGENILYEHKKKYFSQLSKKDIKYIKMRHYAVIAYAEIRRKKYWKFLENLIRSFISSPIDFFSIIRNR